LTVEKSREFVMDVREINPVLITGIWVESDGTGCDVTLNIQSRDRCIIKFKNLKAAFYYFIELTDACLLISKETGHNLTGGQDD